MTKLPQELEKKRDELAAEHAEDTWLSDYQNGFDSGALEVKAMADEKLVEALRKCVDRYFDLPSEQKMKSGLIESKESQIARKALAEWEAGWKG